MNTKSLRRISFSGAFAVCVCCLAVAQTGTTSTSSTSPGAQDSAGKSSGMSAPMTGAGMMSGSTSSGTSLTGSASTMVRSEDLAETAGLSGTAGMAAESGMTGGPRMQQMMQMWGLTPEMLRQGRLMMHAKISRNDPAALLGLGHELNLTSAQRSKLQSIEREMQSAALAVLTSAQQTTLDRYPVEAGSMAQLHAQMMAHMRQKKAEGAGAPTGRATSPCAMMDLMMRQGPPTPGRR